MVTLIGLVILTYIRGLPNGFVAEDFYTILDFQIPFPNLIQQIQLSARPRPIWCLFMWVIRQVFGVNPSGYHLTLIILHILAVLLIFLVTYSLSKNRVAAFLAAVLFAVYPRHHQTVLWYSANQYLLMTILSLICIYGFHQYLETRRKRWYVLHLVMLILAIMTQEAAIVLFALLPLLDITLSGGLKRWRSFFNRHFWVKYVPLLVAVLIYFVLIFGGSRIFKLTGDGMAAKADPTMAQSLQNEAYHFQALNFTTLKSMVGYITYGVYPYIPLRSLDSSVSGGLLLAGSALVMLAVLFVTQSNLVRYMLVWFVMSFTPYVLFVPFGNADRYFYLPAVGLCIAGGIVLSRLYNKVVEWHLQAGEIALDAAIALYVIMSVISIEKRIDEWRTAGEIATALVDQAVQLEPDPPPNGLVVFVAPPKQYEQAYLLGMGISPALQYRYQLAGIPVTVYQINDAEVQNFLLDAKPAYNHLDKLCVFIYEDGIILDKSNTVTDLRQLKPENWVN